MPPFLLLLNGPPGIGKSTVARRLAADRPLALCLDVDLVRGMLGGWQDAPQDSGLLARALAVVMARHHVSGGHDVIVPQAVGRHDFVDQLEAAAQAVDGAFVHVLLTDDRARAVDRFERRSSAPDRTAQHESAATTSGGREGLGTLYDAIHALAAERPGVHVVPSVEGDVDATCRRVAALLPPDRRRHAGG